MSNVERRISNFERGNANVITSSPHHHHHAALATDLVATDFLESYFGVTEQRHPLASTSTSFAKDFDGTDFLQGGI